MSEPILSTLFAGHDATLQEWSCEGIDTGHEEECKPAFELVFVTRGLFAAVSQGEEVILTPNEIWLQPPHVPYRIRHPRGGDECTVLIIDPPLLDEYLGTLRGTTAPGSAQSFRTQHELRQKGRRRHLLPLEFEESVRSLLQSTFSPEERPLSVVHRRIARRAQEFLAAHPTQNVTMHDVAAAVDSSPYHLCRVFRRATGETLHRYQLSLRLRAALSRLADGDRDLTTVALDLGFADHSHFTNAFRRAFGYPPSRLRDLR